MPVDGLGVLRRRRCASRPFLRITYERLAYRLLPLFSLLRKGIKLHLNPAPAGFHQATAGSLTATSGMAAT